MKMLVNRFVRKTLFLPLMLAVTLPTVCLAQSLELPLPKLPPELRLPQERAAYLLDHFWDAMDFADTLRSRNRLFVEQNLANYLSVFPHADRQILPASVTKLTRQAEADSVAFRLLIEFSEIYLNRHKSPMRNEEYFILFLEAQLSSSLLTATERSHLEYQLRQAAKNRRGTVASDFRFIDRNGKHSSLHSVKAPRLLLVFYSTDCDDCRQALGTLSRDSLLQSLIDSTRLAVLAVCVDDTFSRWNAMKVSLPPSWHVAYAGGEISDSDRYLLLSLPVIYLLDDGKRVLLKETSPSALNEYLAKQHAK